MDNVEKVARAIRSHFASDMAAREVARAALSAIDPVVLVQAGIDAAEAVARKQVGPNGYQDAYTAALAIRALSASDVLKEMK